MRGVVGKRKSREAKESLRVEWGEPTGMKIAKREVRERKRERVRERCSAL